MKLLLILFNTLIASIMIAQTPSNTWDEKKFAQITCTVNDFKGKPRINETIIFEGNKTKPLMFTTDKNGKIVAYLPKGDRYKIKLLSLGEDLDEDELEIPDSEDQISASIEIQFELPLSVTLNDVLYKSGSAILDPQSFKSLDKLVLIMERKPVLEIEVIGHTDNVGDAEANQLLSEKRAASVKAYLIKKGIKAERVKSSGKGPSEPVADNDSEKGRKLNRRTEIKILKE